jgi:hypothetical protein
MWNRYCSIHSRHEPIYPSCLTYREGVAVIHDDPSEFMNIRSRLTDNTGDTVTLFMQLIVPSHHNYLNKSLHSFF